MTQTPTGIFIAIIIWVAYVIARLWISRLIDRSITNAELRRKYKKEISRDLNAVASGLTLFLAFAFLKERVADTVAFIGKVLSMIVGLLATIKLIIDCRELLRDGNSNLN